MVSFPFCQCKDLVVGSYSLLLSPFMKVIWNFWFNTTKNYNVNFDLDLRATSSVRISETKRDFGVGPKPRRSLCSGVSPALSWKWPSMHACARFGSVYFQWPRLGCSRWASLHQKMPLWVFFDDQKKLLSRQKSTRESKMHASMSTRLLRARALARPPHIGIKFFQLI